ncbi:MAG TPA: YIP1 family protein [Gammaproteobacteria bacterium]|jgi:hypothetical protein|nr:YIP1 family protein [Gammaproteobacteria bacterium]
MSTATSSSLTLLTNVITAPAQAFATLKERPTVWLPLLIVLVLYCLVSYVYTVSVDLPWLVDQQLQQTPNLTNAQREQAVQAVTRVPAAVYGALGAGGAAVVIAIVLALSALYYTVVSFATGDGVKYRQWFALAAWCAVPIVFGVLASLVHVLAADARFMRQEELNPFSFGNLLGVDFANVTRFQRFLLSLDVTAVWSLVLSIVGYQVFTKRSLALSAAIVLGPLAVIVAVGTLLALR